MALKKRELISAAGILFLAWGSLALWVPAIAFIGLAPLAFLLGVVVTVAYVLYLVAGTSNGLQNVSLQPFASSTALAFTSSNTWNDETAALKQRSVYHEIDVLPTHSLISLNIDAFLDLLQRDFVHSWYGSVSSGSAFPNEVDRAIRTAVSRIAHQITKLDFVQIGVTRVLPILNLHLKNFTTAEEEVRGKNFNREITDMEALDAAIAARYRNRRLHPAASLSASKNTGSQQQHLRKVAAGLLNQVLPVNMTTSDSVLVLVRELVACAALLPILQTLCNPDILNQMIEAYGRSVIQERKTVKKLRAALDEHSQPTSKDSMPARLPKLSPDDSERSFEKFIRTIRKCTVLNDARRFRSEVVQQLRKDNLSRDVTYLKRLEVGVKLLDRQIAKLSSDTGSIPPTARLGSDPTVGASAAHYEPTLRETLYDASGLSYFMEYMDREKLMPLVQFWIVVDGFRNPLDAEGDGAEGDSTTFTSWTSSDRQDVLQIYEAYLCRPEVNVPSGLLSPVKDFLDAGKDATDAAYASARRAIVAIQERKLGDMNETHFPAFKRSDLYFKWVASGQGVVAKLPSASFELDTDSKKQPPVLSPISRSSAVSSQPGLRKAAASASDLVSVGRRVEGNVLPRRSVDDSMARPPLFEDSDDYTDSEAGDTIRSTQSLDAQPRPSSANPVDAVQAKLDELMDETPNEQFSISDHKLEDQANDNSPRGSVDELRSDAILPTSSKGKPSLASLGLLGPTSEDFFGDEEPDTESKRSTRTTEAPTSKSDLRAETKSIEVVKTEEKQPVQPSNNNHGDDIREAAPGDLGLAELIQDLIIDLEKLERQQSILASLKKKAELTNNAAELRILQKSESDLDREITRKQMQKQQYMVQETENALYGRTKIAIPNIMVGTEEDGHEFAIYVVEIRRDSGEKDAESTWAVARRYSEFHDLHKRLRARFPAVRDLNFPRRQMVLTFSKDLLKKRQLALEKYLRDLLTMPAVCRSIEFRAFLSQQRIRSTEKVGDRQLDRQDFVTRIYNSVTDGMEEFFGNIPALDQLSAAGQSLMSAASAAATPTSPDGPPPAVAINTDDPSKIAEAQAEVNAFTEDKPTPTTTFIQPICDAFLELFQLHQGNSWLRGRAVVVVLQQLLGGTVERKVRDSFKHHTTEQSLVQYLALLKDTIWPDGRFRQAPPPRSAMEKAKSKREAGVILATLLPDMAGSVVGRTNAAKAGRRIFAAMNNETLNVHLMYTIFDELIEIIFETL